jgi:hypothetical protein
VPEADSKSTFIAIKAPFRSLIEVPDPIEIASHYRSLGYDED